MNFQIKIIPLIILILSFACGPACDSGGRAQMGEANQLVDAADRELAEAKDLYERTENRNTGLFSATIKTAQEFTEYKTKMTGEAQSIVADYEKVSKMLTNISEKYETVSHLDIPEKYQSYARLKADEFAKRAEAIGIRKNNTQAFTELDDPRSMTKKFDENNSKSDRLFKDAEDMASSAKKMEEEYKSIFSRI